MISKFYYQTLKDYIFDTFPYHIIQNNIVFDSDLHEAEVFSENDNELINGDKIYIFKNNEWRIKSEGDIEEIDEDLRNLLEDFQNKEIIKRQ